MATEELGARELTIEHVLADPIVRALMWADHIDPYEFEALLRSVAARNQVARSKKVSVENEP